MKRIAMLFFVTIMLHGLLFAQHHETDYVPETDPLVLKKLEQWQGLKFGLLMHWGAYSQWGIVESWSLCPEDHGWCRRFKGENFNNYFEYKKEYENLQTTFNPVKFDPDKWAKAAKDAGMRYVVFTTKHHDGFCMFDSKETDYKITGKKTPFHSHKKSNVTKEIFDSFRKQGLWTGAYFSKPDWHNGFYWHPYFPPMDRNVNYDPEEYPERWEKFVQFTHNQIMELMTDYGKVDILWLDGGWVAKTSTEEVKEFYRKQLQRLKSGFVKNTIVNQDIRMDELVEKVREKQPGLIVVDRAVKGKNQNYLTPENRVPDKELPYPWESCIIAGGGWSWVPNAKYKSGKEAVHLLVDIVAKGGNLLFNIAPGPDGTWHDGAYKLLKEMGKWMKVNSEAIYETQAIAPYKEGKVCLTKKKDGSVYAIYLAGNEEKTPPSKIWLSSIQPEKGVELTMLGVKGTLNWEPVGNGFFVEIPESVQKNPPCDYAWAVKISAIK
ncbi:alpha-L-fucosidase [candidate division KSB1 bacterium]|nr:alpha-L-fucosidase [candidate division KSB1 bacterium]